MLEIKQNERGKVDNKRDVSLIAPQSDTQLWYRDLRMALLFTDGYRLCCFLIFIAYCIGIGIIAYQTMNDEIVWLESKE